MMRPCVFGYNFETARSNAFQKIDTGTDKDIFKTALKEFDAFANVISKNNIDVLTFEDTENPQKPDAVFPNNWFSTHVGGKIILYPMLAANRRVERRNDVLEQLQKKFSFKDVIDLSTFEKENKFLEGTGSLVFNHASKKLYASLSERTNPELVNHVARILQYTPVIFSSADSNGKTIYHTNVMITIGNGFAVVCADAISDANEKEVVLKNLKEDGLEVILIEQKQMQNFCGNLLQLKDTNNQALLVMSEKALMSFEPGQLKRIEKFTGIVSADLTTIENVGGGGARCMLAEIYK